MILDDPILKAQFLKINSGSPTPVHWDYKAEFIDEFNNVILAHNVVSIERFTKYDKQTTDDLYISLQVYKTVNIRLQACNPRKLRLRLISIPNVTTGKTDKVGTRTIEVFSAYLTNNSSEAVETRPVALTGQRTDNMGELVEIDVQLVEQGLAEFRLHYVGGTYRNVKLEHLIQGLMSQPLKSLSDSEEIGYGVHVEPPHNTERKYQVPIPANILLIDLPRWVQDTYGLYSSDIGYYLTQQMWYIYPLYDFSRFNTATKRLTIFNVPKNEMLGLDNTYLKEGGNIYIYATGDSRHIDVSNRNLDNSGNAFLSAKSGNLLDHYTVTSKGKTETPPNQNLMRLGFDQRPGKLNNVAINKNMFTNNPWVESSKIISGLGSIVIVKWEASNPKLLLPGMPIKLFYKDKGVLKFLIGTLLQAESLTVTNQKSTIDTRYISETILTLWCAQEHPSSPLT